LAFSRGGGALFARRRHPALKFLPIRVVLDGRSKSDPHLPYRTAGRLSPFQSRPLFLSCRRLELRRGRRFVCGCRRLAWRRPFWSRDVCTGTAD